MVIPTATPSADCGACTVIAGAGPKVRRPVE